MVLVETRSMTFYAGVPHARMFDVDVTLTARDSVRFEDHQDSVLGVRLSTAFDEVNGGKVMNAEGYLGELGARGRASRYIDWFADVAGERVGFAILDHPGNLHSPARWHIRSFGLVAVNPFGKKVFDPDADDAGHSLAKDESIRLRYRIIVHTDKFDLEAAYRGFVQAGAETPRGGE